MIDKNLFFKLFKNCIPVKGYARSVIYDLQREKYDFIPNDLYDIIKKFEGRKIADVFKFIAKKHHSDLHDYFDFLIKKEYLILSKDSQFLKQFPAISLTKNHPNFISNSVMYGCTFDKNLNRKIESLIKFGCYNFSLHITSKFRKNELFGFIDFINATPFRYVELYFNYEADISYSDFTELVNSTNRFITLFFTNSPFNKQKKEKSICIIYTTHTELTIDNSSRVRPIFFYINYNLFIESISFNTFFYKKIYVSENNEILLHPLLDTAFGKLTLKNVTAYLKSPLLEEYWSLNKTNMSVCKSCEFRHMCVDNRLPVKRNHKEWYHLTECNYNPYIAKWKGEKGYKTLAECGITNGKNRLSINSKLLNTVQKELWE